jgi:hypothetical protein
MMTSICCSAARDPKRDVYIYLRAGARDNRPQDKLPHARYPGGNLWVVPR